MDFLGSIFGAVTGSLFGDGGIFGTAVDVLSGVFGASSGSSSGGLLGSIFKAGAQTFPYPTSKSRTEPSVPNLYPNMVPLVHSARRGQRVDSSISNFIPETIEVRDDYLILFEKAFKKAEGTRISRKTKTEKQLEALSESA